MDHEKHVTARNTIFIANLMWILSLERASLTHCHDRPCGSSMQVYVRSHEESAFEYGLRGKVSFGNFINASVIQYPMLSRPGISPNSAFYFAISPFPSQRQEYDTQQCRHDLP